MVEVGMLFEGAAAEATAVATETTALLSGQSAVSTVVAGGLEGSMYGLAEEGAVVSEGAVSEAALAAGRAGQGLRAMVGAAAVTASAIGRKRKHDGTTSPNKRQRTVHIAFYDGLLPGRAIGFRRFPNFYTQ